MVEATGQEAADETMSAMTNTSMEPMLPEQRAGHQGALTASGFLPEKELRWQWTEGVMSFFLSKKKRQKPRAGPDSYISKQWNRKVTTVNKSNSSKPGQNNCKITAMKKLKVLKVVKEQNGAAMFSYSKSALNETEYLSS